MKKINKKSLTKNSIFYLMYNVLNVIFPFITGVYVSHILLPNQIGVVETARNLVQYFVIFSFLGIPTYGLREISQNRNDMEKLNKTYSELMIINGISTFCFNAIYILFIIFNNAYKDNMLLYLIVGSSITLNFFNNSWLYEGLEEFKYISLRNVFFKCISFILLILFVKTQNDYLNYAWITVIGTAGNYIFNIINARKNVKFTFKNLNFRKHIKPIMYLVVVNLAIEIYSLIDITMLGMLCDKDTVAFYSYGIKIYKILLQIVNTFTMVLVPRISLYYKEHKIKEFNHLLTKTFNLIVLLTIPMIIGINFTSYYLVTTIYGSVYIRSAVVLNIVSLILLISPIGYLLGSRVLLVTNNENKMVIPVTFGAIVNVIGNYILINRYQEVGAAIASVLSELVVMIIYICLGKKYFKLEKIKKSILKVVFISLIMFLYLYIVITLKLDKLIITIIQILGAVIIYLGGLILLKEEFCYSYFKKIKEKFI